MKLVFAIVLFGLSISALAQVPRIDAPVCLDLPTLARTIHAADFDGDGDVDLMRRAGATVVVAHNDGAAVFSEIQVLALDPMFAGGREMVIDVTGDGRDDLVVVRFNTNAVTNALVLPATPNGQLGAPQIWPLTGRIEAWAAGDANGDGRVDLAISYAVGGLQDIAWFLSDGVGAFTSQGPVGSVVVEGLAAVDYDDDGDTDVIATTSGAFGTVLVMYENDASALLPFVIAAFLPAASHYDIVTGDLDNDGRTDTVLRNAGQIVIGLQGAPGSWSFSSPITSPNAGTSTWGYHSRLADWNSDGALDLMMGNTSLSLFEGDGAGGLTLRTEHFPIADSAGVGWAADIDGDGINDHVGRRSIYLGRPDVAFPVVEERGALRHIRDVDGDADPDIVWIMHGTSPQEIRLEINDGTGSFTEVSHPLPGNGYHPTRVNLGDFDGDGFEDLLLGTLTDTSLFKSFATSPTFAGFVTPVGLSMEAGISYDVDQDGDLDVCNEQGIWLNDGTGVFATPSLPAPGWTPLAADDLDGDGDTDFLGRIFGDAGIFRGIPGGYTFEVLATGTFGVPIPVVVADADDDGDLDLVHVDGTPTFYINTAGVFTATPGSSAPLMGAVIAFEDMDGDGNRDLVVRQFSSLFGLSFGLGGFLFEDPEYYRSDGPEHFVDIDGDGDIDIITRYREIDGLGFDGLSAGSTEQYGAGSSGEGGYVPLLSVIGPHRVGETITTRLTRAAPGTSGLLVGALDALVPAVEVLVGVPVLVANVLFICEVAPFGPAPGQASVDLPMVVPPHASNFTGYLQALILDPFAASGIATSNGVRLTFGQ